MVSVLLAEKFVTLGAVKNALKARMKFDWCNHDAAVSEPRSRHRYSSEMGRALQLGAAGARPDHPELPTLLQPQQCLEQGESTACPTHRSCSGAGPGSALPFPALLCPSRLFSALPGSALPLRPGSGGSYGRLGFLLRQSKPQVALSTSTHGENANTAVLLFMEIARGVSVLGLKS